MRLAARRGGWDRAALGSPLDSSSWGHAIARDPRHPPRVGFGRLLRATGWHPTPLTIRIRLFFGCHGLCPCLCQPCEGHWRSQWHTKMVNDVGWHHDLSASTAACEHLRSRVDSGSRSRRWRVEVAQSHEGSVRSARAVLCHFPAGSFFQSFRFWVPHPSVGKLRCVRAAVGESKGSRSSGWVFRLAVKPSSLP